MISLVLSVDILSLVEVMTTPDPVATDTVHHHELGDRTLASEEQRHIGHLSLLAIVSTAD